MRSSPQVNGDGLVASGGHSVIVTPAAKLPSSCDEHLPKMPTDYSDTPSTPRSAAVGRIDKRYKELLESECTLCDDMDQLIVMLAVTSQDKTWKLRTEHVQLIQRTCSSISELVRVHSSIRERMAMFACPEQLAGTFQSSLEFI